MSNTDHKTNGRRAPLLATLEKQVREAIDNSYLTGEKYPSGGRVVVSHDDERADLWGRNANRIYRLDLKL